MFKNLEAEMVRHQITRNDLAILLGVRYATIADRINGKYKFYLIEAVQIKEAFFSDLTLEYLFEMSQEVGENDETV